MQYLAILGCALLVACVADDPSGKGPEHDAATVVEHGALDGAAAATISADAPAHAWTFTVAGATDVEIATAAAVIGPEVDTVVYLHADDGLVDRNDDDGDARSSLLALPLPPGEYRVVVKGYGRDDVGAFALTVTCDGGCAPPAVSSSRP